MSITTDRMSKLLKLLEAEPNDALCLYSLAQEHAKRGDHAAAISYYDRTLESDRAYLYAYFHKARSQQAMGDAIGAIRTLQDGLERAEASGDAKAAAEISALLAELRGSGSD